MVNFSEKISKGKGIDPNRIDQTSNSRRNTWAHRPGPTQKQGFSTGRPQFTMADPEPHPSLMFLIGLDRVPALGKPGG